MVRGPGYVSGVDSEESNELQLLEGQVRALEGRLAALEGRKRRPLGAALLGIVFVGWMAMFVLVGVNIGRPVPAEAQVDPLVWTQVVASGAVLLGSLGSLFLRFRGSPFWGEAIALVILAAGAGYTFIAAISELTV